MKKVRFVGLGVKETYLKRNKKKKLIIKISNENSR